MDNFRKIKKFLRDEQGLTVVEYVLGAAALVGAIILIFGNMGTSLDTKMNNTISKVS